MTSECLHLRRQRAQSVMNSTRRNFSLSLVIGTSRVAASSHVSCFSHEIPTDAVTRKENEKRSPCRIRLKTLENQRGKAVSPIPPRVSPGYPPSVGNHSVWNATGTFMSGISCARLLPHPPLSSYCHPTFVLRHHHHRRRRRRRRRRRPYRPLGITAVLVTTTVDRI